MNFCFHFGGAQIIVLDWLNNPQLERLCFGLSSSGSLAAYNAFPATSKGKICYFIRKHAVPLTSDNLRDVSKRIKVKDYFLKINMIVIGYNIW